ncbi:MAG: putative dimethyl sulfoxide reductase chain YnfE [Alphaproteobacteria bacterium MarineAlpha9_Bin4]|nr:MAG: putative dimethyl sulfoxide reductase chain YnfE [Alphaproteobacteria bacterium MarineAlpha9_Bin4]
MYKISTSACPHDCPSTCVLDIEHDNEKILKVKGNTNNTYTKGIICSKVSRYPERTHNNKRLTVPLIRVGKKGEGIFKPSSWDDALNIVSKNLKEIIRKHGSQAVWPYFYAGTMGLIQRDSINRLRHYFNFSGQYSTICTTLAATGWLAGTGCLKGADPREVIYSKIIVMWGGNPASTQVNFMKHVQEARKKRNAFFVVIDPYQNKTARLADLHIKIRPGTDGALACAIMHNILKNRKEDEEYLKKYTKDYDLLSKHLKIKTPEWAEKITGVPVKIINKFSKILCNESPSYFRLGYGFTRQRNGSFNMHAVSCIPTLLGSWKYKGGGAFYNNSGIYNIDKDTIEGLRFINPKIRILDQSRIGPILNNDLSALNGGPNVKAIFIQNTNPLVVAPETNKVRTGFKRKDLFVCVHEQFMTETAKYADVLLPATSFVEHDDIYISGGHQHLTYGPKLIKNIGKSWSNNKLINELAKRLGSKDECFKINEKQIINITLKKSKLGNFNNLKKNKFLDLQPSFEESHFLNGFGHKDKRFHFSPKWKKDNKNFNNKYNLPDHYELIEKNSKKHPFKLVTAPAHNFLNSSFTELDTSKKKEIKPTIKIHPKDLKELNLISDEIVMIGNNRGKLRIHTEKFSGLLQGITIVEGIWPNEFFLDNLGINTLVGSDVPEPAGGAVFHDVAIWIKKIN